MSKPLRKRNPNLAKSWDEYGHAIPFDDLFDAKFAMHGYVVLAWREKDGSVGCADLASPDQGKTWEFQNDDNGPMTLKQWKALRIVPDCDWFTVPEEDQ